ncbi:MAG TPA: 30S ribosomal protein S21 [Vitreimonas sp.]|nr:30S ribosomal protein S21 [Vitreimonas sp.]
MPIIIKAQGNDSTNDLIKKFKKVVVATDIVQTVKDRRYYQKPSRVKAVRTIEKKRLQKRVRSLKRMKNVSPQVLTRIQERINS